MWLGALIFLGTVAFLFVCAVAIVAALLAGRLRLALLGTFVAASVICLYGGALVAIGLGSGPRELRLGEEKHICELDCHLAYAVVSTARPQPEQFVVNLRMRFDETTIGPNRGNGPLAAGPRRILLEDVDGRSYRLSSSSGLDTSLRPGEATEATLRFKVPANARPARLRFEDADPSKRLLIGSETAPLHKRTVFRVG